ncbi:GNAT family N-acetyltransferase [Paraglaciecola aestuariivivens]
MAIRRATQQDAEPLAKLILASATHSLNIVFSLGSETQALDFLTFSLNHPDGQFGYQNHWVIEIDNQLVACVCAWTNQLPESFHQATLASLVSFYDPSDLLTVIQRSKVLQECLPKPTSKEWCVGHIAVAQSHRRKGLGKKLIKTMQHQAQANNKSCLSLDVEKSNIDAVKFYLDQGFRIKSESKVTINMQALGIGQHLHLTKDVVDE